MIKSLCNLDVSKLNWGSVPDWLGAVGTIVAVFVAVYLPYRSTIPKGKVTLSWNYYTPIIELLGVSVSFINTGSTAINIKKISLGIVGTTKAVYLSDDLEGGVLQPGEEYVSGVSSVALYDALKSKYGSKPYIEVRPQAFDSLGHIFHGKKHRINFTQFERDVLFQRNLYNSSPISMEDDKVHFKTKKID